MTQPLCLLFDSDGTLVDSEILLATVMCELLPNFSLPFTARQYMEEFRGVRFKSIIETLEERHQALEEGRYPVMEAEMREAMEARMRAELVAIAGIPEALDALSEYPKAIVSNGPERKIRCAMQSTKLAHHFADNLFSAYTLGVWKPDPALFLKAAKGMGVAPSTALSSTMPRWGWQPDWKPACGSFISTIFPIMKRHRPAPSRSVMPVNCRRSSGD